MRKLLTLATLAIALTACTASPTTTVQSMAPAVERTASTPEALPTVTTAPVVELAPAQHVPTEEPITAPVQALELPVLPTVPLTVQQPVTAPVQPLPQATQPLPQQQPIPSLPDVPKVTTEPAVIYSPEPDQPVVFVGACSEFEVRAEDGTCVPNNYWNVPEVPSIPPYTDADQTPPVVCKGNCPNVPYIPPTHAEPNPLPDYCAAPELGDAHAGIGLTCNLPAKP